MLRAQDSGETNMTPYRPIPLDVPEGMKPNEFFNSAENLADLVHNNGLLRNPEGLLLYRKALGHSNEFDGSIIYDTSQRILDPLGRPVRRTQVPSRCAGVEPHEPHHHRVHAGALSRTRRATSCWPARPASTPPGRSPRPACPRIRMLHNHFIVFDKADNCAAAPLADPDNPNLTDGGQHSLFQAHMREAYRAFFAGLDLQILRPCERRRAAWR
jgi:hypothetical protein